MSAPHTRFVSLSFLVMLAPAFAQQQIGLRVSEEVAPAGSVAQIKVSVTEPKPIIHGNMAMDMDFSFDLLGIALYSSRGTVSGIAYRKQGGLQVRFNDPSATLGMEPDYPVLTIAVGVPRNAVPGARMPVSVNLDTSQWISPLGLPYAEESKPGSVSVGGSVAVNNVVPGGGRIAAGESFRILGTGFQPDVRVDLEYVEDLETRFVNSGEILMTARTAFDLDGKRIRVRQRNQPNVFYYSYLRGERRTASTLPLLEQSEPIFPMRSTAAAIGVYPFLRPNQVAGIALQNPNRTAATVTVSALSPFLKPIASATVTLAPGEEFVKSLPELMTVPPGCGAFLRIYSSLPVQYIPLVADPAAGEIQPLMFASLSPAAN
ncbi:MAG: hypothetical protein J0L64_12635 [Acidobacteria bacterium]|nr:hypothetical protein [Acidobacteriota bacterium]